MPGAQTVYRTPAQDPGERRETINPRHAPAETGISTGAISRRTMMWGGLAAASLFAVRMMGCGGAEEAVPVTGPELTKEQQTLKEFSQQLNDNNWRTTRGRTVMHDYFIFDVDDTTGEISGGRFKNKWLNGAQDGVVRFGQVHPDGTAEFVWSEGTAADPHKGKAMMQRRADGKINLTVTQTDPIGGSETYVMESIGPRVTANNGYREGGTANFTTGMSQAQEHQRNAGGNLSEHDKCLGMYDVIARDEDLTIDQRAEARLAMGLAYLSGIPMCGGNPAGENNRIRAAKQQFIKLTAELPRSDKAAIAELGIASILAWEGDKDKAIEYCKRSESAAARIRDPTTNTFAVRARQELERDGVPAHAAAGAGLEPEMYFPPGKYVKRYR